MKSCASTDANSNLLERDACNVGGVLPGIERVA